MKGALLWCLLLFTVLVFSTTYDVRSTDKGQVRGLLNDTSMCRSWRGIPFAADTGGNNRWRAPQPRASWDPTVWDATNFAAGCTQVHHNPDVPTNQSEDCLNVNVFAPYNCTPGACNLGVTVWVHGGTFDEGWNEGPFDLYDGCNFAQQANIIVVSTNYRLGALGYLVTTGTEDQQLDGNYGFLDQRAAFAWTKNNIQNFGGDPSRITIQGQSAGSMSVGLHFVSPNSYKSGTFRQVLMESNFNGVMLKTTKEARVYGDDFCGDEYIQCFDNTTMLCDADCMRAKPVNNIIAAWNKASGAILPWIIDNWDHLIDGIFSFGPVVDGPGGELPLQIVDALQQGQFDVTMPVLFGTNTGEGETFVYYIEYPLPPESWIVFSDAVWKPDSQLVIDYYQDKFPRFEDGREQISQLLTDYMFRCPSQLYGTWLTQRGGKAWNYRYDHVYSCSFLFPEFGLPEKCVNVTCHASEIPFVFDNTVPSLNATFTDEEVVLVKRFTDYWGSFITYGDPNTNNAQPFWPVYDATTRPDMYITTPEPYVENDSVDLCGNFWDQMPKYYHY